jgi:signal transduction histidine kinase
VLLEPAPPAVEGLADPLHIEVLRLGRTPRARTAIVLATLSLQAVVLAAAGRADGNEFRGVPAVVALTGACVLAALCGPLAGGLVALTTSVAFVATVTDWAFGSWLALPLWIFLATATGWATNGLIAEHDQRKRLVTRLVESERRAAVARIAAGIAHHFNNKLMTIIGNVALARKNVVHDAQLAEALQRIATASEQLAVLSRSLLIISGGRVGPTASADVAACLRAIEHSLAAAIAPHPLRLDVTEGLDPVRLGREELIVLMTHLVSNAAEASPASVDVGVAVRAGGSDVVLEVRDSGAGMDSDQLRLAFEPFYSTKPPAVTAGLGLPVAQALVEKAGGSLTVATQPGDGTTVTVQLPRAVAPPTELGAQKAPESPRPRPPPSRQQAD